MRNSQSFPRETVGLTDGGLVDLSLVFCLFGFNVRNLSGAAKGGQPRIRFYPACRRLGTAQRCGLWREQQPERSYHFWVKVLPQPFWMGSDRIFFSVHHRGLCYGAFDVTASVRQSKRKRQQTDVSLPCAAYLRDYAVSARRNPVNSMTHAIHISEILSQKGGIVWSVSPDATVLEAIQMMADKNVGALLVTKDNHLVGVISERDYTRKVVLKGRSSKDTPVRDIISGKIISVSPDHSVEECMRLMTENRIRHLPVVQGTRILGVISIGDLVNSIISHQTSAIQQLETYITGYPTPPV